MSDFFLVVLIRFLAGFFVGIAGAAATVDPFMAPLCGISAACGGALYDWLELRRSRRAGKPQRNDVVPSFVAIVLGSVVAAFAAVALRVRP